MLPDRHDGVPEGVAEAFDVRVAVLGYDRGEARRGFEGETECDRGAVVENVDGVAGDVKGGEEEAEGLGEVGECEVVGGWGGGEAEAREIRGEDVVGWGEERDEVAELVARGRETVQEKEKGIGRGSGFGVGKVRAVRDGEVVVGQRMQSHGSRMVLARGSEVLSGFRKRIFLVVVV